MHLAVSRQRIEAGLLEFAQRKHDASWLAACLPVIAAIDEWKFSTGFWPAHLARAALTTAAGGDGLLAPAFGRARGWRAQAE